MSTTVWIALFSTSAWGVINTLAAAWVIRKRTSAETERVARESDSIEQDREDKIYKRLRGQISDAIMRAEHAEGRADEAIDRSNWQGRRIMALVEMFEAHAPWDRLMREKLIELGVPADEIPVAPLLNPYEVLQAMERDLPQLPHSNRNL